MAVAVKRQTSVARAHRLISHAVYGLVLCGSAVALMSSADVIETALRRIYAEVTLFRVLELAAAACVLGAFALFVQTKRTLLGRARADRRSRDRLLRRSILDATPTWFLLSEIMIIAAGVRVALDRAATVPRVLGDELIYTSLGKSLARAGEMTIRGTQSLDYGVLYPIAISPAYFLSDDGVAGFQAIQVMNAVFMSLTAVPTYLLARKILDRGWALICAGLAVAAPATVYSTLVMTESLFYPLYVLSALALVSALERPSLARQLMLGASLILLFLTRHQAVALVLAVASASIVYGAVRGSVRRTLRDFLPTYIAVASIAVTATVTLSLLGQTSSGSLGAYGVLVRSYSPLDLVTWSMRHLALVALSTGVIAFCAFLVMTTSLLRRSSTDCELAFASSALSMFMWTLISVAVLSASPWGLERMHERNLFFVLPLVFIAFAHWIASGLPRPRTLAISSASVVIVASLFLVGDLVHFMSLDAPTLLPWAEMWLALELDAVPVVRAIAALVALGAVCFLLVRSKWTPMFSVLLALVVVASAIDWVAPISRSSVRELAWIDSALPSDSSAALINVTNRTGNCASSAVPPSTRWLAVLTEFFNKDVTRVAYVDQPLGLDGLGYATKLTVARDGTLVDGALPYGARFVIAPSSVDLAGVQVGRLDAQEILGQRGGLTLWMTPGTVKLRKYELDVWGGRTC